mmetsp:Transcript_7537/g.21422  ORF Transcript_7537/g.21422 Transcript_7537/m.21422 type:complete len:238 (-) Transcript_7537:208-921(-)
MVRRDCSLSRSILQFCSWSVLSSLRICSSRFFSISGFSSSSGVGGESAAPSTRLANSRRRSSTTFWSSLVRPSISNFCVRIAVSNCVFRRFSCQISRDSEAADALAAISLYLATSCRNRSNSLSTLSWPWTVWLPLSLFTRARCFFSFCMRFSYSISFSDIWSTVSFRTSFSLSLSSFSRCIVAFSSCSCRKVCCKRSVSRCRSSRSFCSCSVPDCEEHRNNLWRSTWFSWDSRALA